MRDTTDGTSRLLAVMARLRDPDGGCPWDVEQTFETIAPYTIEEAYEVADAIARADMDELRGELGDLLLQVVFHARMAEEAGHFAYDDVAHAIADKMIDRHPHVFGTDGADTPDAVKQTWEARKAEERAAKASKDGRVPSLMDDVALALPALMRAEKLQKRVARVGFDWDETAPVFAKVLEELEELRAVHDGAEDGVGDPDRLEDEVGDLLFTVANLARHLRVDPEKALRRTNEKVVRRFRWIEDSLRRDGLTFDDVDLAGLDARWNKAKVEEG